MRGEDLRQGADEQGTHEGGQRGREQQPAEVRLQPGGHHAAEVLLDALREERGLERVGGAGDEHQEVEERERHGDAARPCARDPDTVASVPIRWITNVSRKITASCQSICLQMDERDRGGSFSTEPCWRRTP
jgi:hypothetical protein